MGRIDFFVKGDWLRDRYPECRTMEPRTVLSSGKPQRFGVALVVLAIGLTGVVMAHHPTLFSGFRRIQTDLGDTRFNHYLLEHGFLWACGVKHHRAFWDLPDYYPVPNMAAYSDILLSVGPIYWLWRAAGAAPDLAFSGWMICMSALNYGFAVALFRKGAGLGWLASAAAGFLVAFGAPRINQLMHQQLLPCFFVSTTILALVLLFGDRPRPISARAGLWLLAVLGGVVQLYCGYYLTWFLTIAIAITSLAAVLLPSSRASFFRVLRRDWWMIGMTALIGFLLLLPLLRHYLPVAGYLATRQYMQTYYAFNPYPSSWFHVGGGHWTWGWTAAHEPFKRLSNPQENTLGFGLMTPLVCAAGLYLGRRQPICRLGAAVAVALVLGTTYLPGKTIALIAFSMACWCQGSLFRRTEATRERMLGWGTVLAMTLLVPFPNVELWILAANAMVFCFLELVRTRGRPVYQAAPAAFVGLLSFKLLSFEVLGIGASLVAPAALVVAYFWKQRRAEIAFGAVAVVIFFGLLITLSDNPLVIVAVLAAPLGALLLTMKPMPLPSPWLALRGLIICMLLVLCYYECDSLWLNLYDKLPGGLGIRAVGRVVLIVLFPAALGLAIFVQFLESRRQTVAASLVVLLCMLEQGVTTASFDTAENRVQIAAVAARIDPGKEAFYYHPPPSPRCYSYQLDAMWASLEAGVPTINGYSGYNPPGWDGFFFVDARPEIDPRLVLEEWERKRRLSPERIQYLGTDPDPVDQGP